MDKTIGSSQAEICSLGSPSPTGNVPCCQSKEKKILQARRQQRHSTEIGSEYYRWWVVRNALGFETNEHIAGLLLDGFHGLLQQLVVMCGGETYQPSLHGEAKTSGGSNDCYEDVAQSPSSTSSSPSASPPRGIENMDEFMEYNSAISHYCSSLWRLCCQQGSQLQQLDKTSQPIQEFLIRLMGYLRSAKGKSFSVNSKKKQFKPNNVRARNVGESKSSQINLAIPGQPTVHHELQCTNVASASNQAMPQDVTRLMKYEFQQGRPEKDMASSGDLSICSTKQVAELAKKISLLPALSNGGDEKKSKQSMEISCENPPTNFHFQAHTLPATSELKEKLTCNQEKVLHPPSVHSQLEFVGEISTELRHQPSQQQHFHGQQETATPQHLLTVPHELGEFQKHSENGQEVNQQQWKQSQQNEAPCPKVEIFNGVSSIQQGNTVKEDRPEQGNTVKEDRSQQKQCSPEQPSCLENKQTCDLGEKDLSSHWWSNIKENCIYPVMSSGSHVREQVAVRDCSLRTCASASSLDSSGTDSKRVGELGFLLTDSLKMLPSIDEVVRDFPQPQGSCSGKGGDGAQVKSLANQTHLPMSLVNTPATDRQAQGCQTSISMISSTGQPAAAGGQVTSRAQSLLNIPKQKAKETQTSTSFYNEIKINLNNPRRSSEVKPQKVVASTTLQPIQPAVLTGTDKPPSLPTSLGTPVILYPARSFSSNDNSLASLASLVHNIVYSSYGTIIKPLSLTPLPSSAAYNSHQLIPPIAMSAIDSNSQRKPIAAALPVLSSQLSANKPTLVPFYISHAAVNSLGSFSKCTALSGQASNTQNVSALQLITQPLCQQHTPEDSTSASLCPDSIASDISSRAALDSTNLLNQLKITDVRSCSSSEFAGTKLAKKETLLSEVSYSSQEIVQKLDMKETKPNNPIHFLQSIKGRPTIINDQLFDSLMKIGTANTSLTNSAISHTCDQADYCPSKSHPENLQEVVAEPKLPPDSHAPSSKATGKILNSLLASKKFSVNNGIYGTSQNSKSMYPMEPACNPNKLMDSDCNFLHKSAEKMSSLSQKENKPQTSSEDSSCEQSKNSAHSQCALKPRSASMSSSSHKPPLNRRLVCPVCNVIFCSSMDLLVHRFEQHGHVCGECDNRFLTLSRLKQHKEVDHPPVLLCPHCRFHTIRREELVKHLWSEHKMAVDKDETQVVPHTDAPREAKEVISPSLNTVIPPQKSPTKLLNLSLDTKETDVCPSNSANVCSKTDSPAKTKESVTAAGTSQGNEDIRLFFDANLRDASCSQVLQSKVECQNEHQRKVSLNDNEFIKDSEQASSGPVFPSFSRAVGNSARSDLETISAMYAQVSQHCHLDTTDFLNTTDHHLSENEEPRLVIDTEFGCVKRECKDNEEYQEKAEQNDKQSIDVRSGVHTKREDKLCGSGSYKGKRRWKHQGSDRNNLLCKLEVGASRVNGLGDEDSKNTQQQIEVNLIVGKGREKKRPAVNIKRRNTTPGCDSQSQKRKRTRNCGGRGRAATDIPFVKMSSPEKLNSDFHISKSSVNRSNNNCNESSVTSCGQGYVKVEKTDINDSSCDKGSQRIDKANIFGSSSDKANIFGSSSDKGNIFGSSSDKGNIFGSSSDKGNIFGSSSDKGNICGSSFDKANICGSSSDKANIFGSSFDKANIFGSRCDRVSKRIDKADIFGSSCDKVSAITYNLDIYDSTCDNISVRSDHTDAIVNSCDKVSGITVHTDSHDSSCESGFYQTTIPTRESCSQPDESIKTHLEHTDKTDSAQKQVEKQSSNLKLKPSTLLSSDSDEIRTLTVPQKELPLQKCHAMSFLSPKKKRLRKSLGPSRDNSSEKEAKNNLQCVNDKTVKTNYEFSNISERTVLASKRIPVSQEADKKGETIEQGRAEGKDSLLNQRKSVSTSQTSFESTVEPALTRSESAILGLGGNVAGRRYECPVDNCNVTFCRRWNMKDHVSKVHAQSTLIVCSVAGCNLKFPNKRELRQHVTVDHMGKTRKYMCSWPDCSKGFFARTHLSIHMLTHTGEKPVACDICDYRCRQRTALIWHLRKHGVFHKTEKMKNLGNSTSSGGS